MPDAAALAQPLRVEIARSGRIDPACFIFASGRARFALAFVSPFLDFAETAAALAAAAAPTPLLAVPTAGEIASAGEDPLYRPCDAGYADAVVAVFPPDLVAEVHLAAIDLGLRDEPREVRVARTAAALSALRPGFPLDARDTVALAFCDGGNGGDAILPEAVFASGAVPLAFIGGSPGAVHPDAPTPVWDGRAVRSGHAALAFLKLAPGRRYGLLKSQNFIPTGAAFVVVDADVSHRSVAALLDPASGTARPAAEVLADNLGVPPEKLAATLRGYSFGAAIGGDTFVRALKAVDPEGGTSTSVPTFTPATNSCCWPPPTSSPPPRPTSPTSSRGSRPPSARCCSIASPAAATTPPISTASPGRAASPDFRRSAR